MVCHFPGPFAIQACNSFDSCSPSAATAIILSGSGAALFLHGLSFAIPAYRPLPAHALVIEVVFAFPVLVSYRPTRDNHTETEASLPLAAVNHPADCANVYYPPAALPTVYPRP